MQRGLTGTANKKRFEGNCITTACWLYLDAGRWTRGGADFTRHSEGKAGWTYTRR